MLCVVDTSVWIDFFRGKVTEKTRLLSLLITQKVDLAYTGVILTEVTLGFAKEDHLRIAKNLFSKLIFLNTSESTYLLASEIYRVARKRGITIRSAIDCIISSTVIQHDAHLLENDRDFVNIAKFFDLKLVSRSHGH